jgi:hypothetical protein
MPVQKQPPIPHEEVIRWCEANRPDLVESIRQTSELAQQGLPTAEAMMLILSVAFQAGRTYQRAPVNADAFLPINKDPYA